MMCLLLVCSAVRKRGEGAREGVGGRSSFASTRGIDWSSVGAAHGPTERLREKSLESLDSGPGEASGTEGGDGRTGDNSFSEPRLKVHLLSLNFSLREIVRKKLNRPFSSPLQLSSD